MQPYVIQMRFQHHKIHLFNDHKQIQMGSLGFQEILLIAAVVWVLFGGKKIPEFMRSLGKGIREFNNAKYTITDESKNSISK